MGKKSDVKHTGYYDLLGVEPDADPKALKKAYYKKARELHPDRGGNEVDFKAMKSAYDVLSDPNKRKTYDKYGESAIKIMEGGVPSNVDFLKTLRKRDKLLIVLAISVVSFFFLLFPILLSVRWDKTSDYSWFIPFIPLYVFQALLIAVFATSMKQAPLDFSNPDVDQEAKDMWSQQESVLNRLRFKFYVVIGLLYVAEIFIPLRLDRIVSWSWYVVLLPLILLFALSLAGSFAFVATDYTATDPEFHKPEDEENGDDKAKVQACTSEILSKPKFWVYLLDYIKWSLAGFITCFLVAYCADNEISFWIAAIPYLTLIGLVLIGQCAHAHILRNGSPPTPESSADEEGQVPAQAAPSPLGILIAWMCTYGMLLVMVTTAAAKLTEDTFSAFAIFSPIFFVVGCLCFCFSCSLACIDEEALMQAEAEQAAASAAAGGQDAESEGLVSEAAEGYGTQEPAVLEQEIIVN